eukprot:3806019-Pleurochrysis_carterae.AAC.2
MLASVPSPELANFSRTFKLEILLPLSKCGTSPANLSDEGVHEVLEIEEVPDLSIELLDGRGRLGVKLLPRESHPDGSGGVASDHEAFAESPRRRDDTGGNGGRVVKQQDGGGTRRDALGAHS